MARFLVKASEFKNVCKAVNDRQLESLKKEIIEILKKQDEKDVKKAIDYFNSQEEHYTHLEKSLISGKWIQKAGYGVGTVRIWKGKKYKKIAPGKWARVFDKEGRGTNIAIGKLIAKVQKIDNVEDLMAFVMQNKQRFVDENGIDLPVLDKLRAAVDAKNNGDMRSKLPDPKDDNSVAEYKKQIKDKVKEYNMNYEKYLENQIAGAERHNVTENELKALKELQIELKGTSKPAEKKEDLEKYNKEMNERRAERQSAEYKEIVDKIPFENDSNKKIFLTGIKAMNISNDMKLDIADWFAKNKIDGRSYADYLIEKVKEGYDKYESSSKGKGVSGKGALYKGNTGIPCDNKAAAYFAQFLAMAKDRGMEELKESEAEKTQNRSEAMKGNQNAKKWGLSDEDLNKMRDIQVKVEEKFKKEYPEPMSEYSETSKKSEIISELARRTKDPEIRKLAIKLRGFDGMLPDEYLESNTKRLDEMIRDRTLKNAGNMRNAIAWEISGMNDYWRSHIDSHQAYALTEYEALANLLEKNSGEIDADGKRYISSALDVLREMKDVYASDYYRKYDYSLPHDEKMEDLIERYTKLAEEYGNGVNKQTEPEQPKPNQESAAAPEEDITESKAKKHRSIPAFEPVKSAAEKKENIAKTTKIEEGKVSIPATREIKNEIKNLLATAAKKSNVLNDARREFLAHVYYDGENLITTDGKKMKVIKIGEIDGIEPNKYIEIDTTGKDDIILKQDEKDYGFYPNYKRVIPDGNKQQIKFDNNALKDKIDEMKKDGSIDLETRRISLKLRDGSVYLDNTRVGDAKDVSFENGKDYITFDYSLLTNALSGDESIMAVSDDPTRAVSISTKVSDNVFMPMVSSDEVDYAKNREVRAAEEEAQAKKQAQDATDAENRRRRNLTNEAKSEILKDKPEGVTDSDYEDLIDYTNDFYVNLGYDNSTPRAKAEIKRTIDNAINQINNKDYAIFDMIQNSDNKVSRKIFETITALKLGSNRDSAKKAWESWVGKEGVENHKKQVEAEQKQREENEKNEKLNRINSRIDQVSKYNGNISDDRKNVVRDYLLNLKVKKDEPTYRALFGNYKYKPNDDSEYITNNGVNFVFDKLKNNGIEYFEKYYTSIKDKPMLNFARYVNATMNSENVKKALFDSFLVDNILTMDIDDLEEDEENESLFNDYSAEQPDLFNSTEMKVQEAFNRCGCCL